MFSGGGDKAVRLWKLEGGQQEVAPQIGAHDAPVKCVGYLPKTNVVVSGGWDKKVSGRLSLSSDFFSFASVHLHLTIIITSIFVPAQVLGPSSKS